LPGRSSRYHLIRLPEEFGELVVVADRFHVKPLLTLLAAAHRFYVLALSQNQVRLLAGTPHGVREVELAGVPQSLREALKYDDLEKELGLHVAGRGGPGAQVVTLPTERGSWSCVRWSCSSRCSVIPGRSLRR
jgi:release factor family 7